MASNSSGLQLVADRKRWGQWSITIGEADGDDATVASNDIVRAKIGRMGDGMLLEVESDSGAGSDETNITAANPTVLTIFGTDLTFAAGIYDVEISIWDTSQDAMKKAERGIFILRDSMEGDIDE